MSAEEARPNILVIDDELGPRESLRYLLKDDYEMEYAEGVDEGVCLLKANLPNLIIMDIKMPGKTGIQGLEEIRAIDKDVPVIMLTGYGTLDTAQQALRLGASDYISKPFDLSEMRGLVKKHINQNSYDRKRVGLLHDLKEMNSQLVEEIASKDRLAALGQNSAELVHDLRNPLMIISGYLDLLSNQFQKDHDQSGEEQKEMAGYLEAIEHSVQRCCQLAEMWSNTSNRGTTAEEATFTVGQLLANLQTGAEPFAAVAEVQLDFDVSAAEEKMSGNSSQLLRALHNVVNNAIDAVKPRLGVVSVSATLESGWTRISVKDNGCGMPQDVLDHMFDPYYTTKGKEKGTGLGTVITRKIVQEHGGRIEVSSCPAIGTCISLILPLSNIGSVLISDEPAEVRVMSLEPTRVDDSPTPSPSATPKHAMTDEPEHEPKQKPEETPYNFRARTMPLPKTGKRVTVQV